MDVTRILTEIDSEIDRLQQARAALISLGAIGAAAKPRRGRPKGSTNAPKTTATKTAAAKTAVKGKRNLSPEGRKRIADAMKRRWAERRKADATKK